VWISSANPAYAVGGVRAGARVAAAQRPLHLGRPFRVGRNLWYFGAAGRTRALVKVRAGTIEEVGIAMPTLTRTRAAQSAFVRSFS
jgi:hypothetical protein